MKANRSVLFSSFILAVLCWGILLWAPGTASASTLGSNLLANPDAETGSITSWTDDTGQGRWFAAENTWNAPYAGTYSFAVQAAGLTASGTWSLSQTVSVSDQSALISAGTLVATLSGWYLKSGSSPDRARLVLQELDASGNILRESGPYCPSTNTWEQGSISQAVMTDTVSLKVLLCGVDLDHNRVQFDDLSLVLTNNSSAAPTIVQGVSNQDITVGDSLGPFNITIDDTDTPLNNLTVTAVSSNQALVTDANLSPGGSGANRTLSVTPVAGVTGEADITINVSDGAKSAQTSFHLKINPAANLGVNLVVNGDASQAAQSTYIPGWSSGDWGRFVLNSGNKSFTVATLPSGGTSIYLEQLINVNARRQLIDNGFLSFQASAGLTGSAELIVSGLNQFNSEIWSYSGSSINQAIPTGTYYIQVKIGGPLGAQTSNVSLVIPNDLPKIQTIADQNISENNNTGAIACKVGYITADVVLTGSSSDQALVPNGNIVFGGTGLDRMVTVTPLSNKSGSCTITVTANDGSNNASRNFTLTVNPIPRVSSVNAPAAGSYKAGSTLTFTVNFSTPVTVSGGTPYLPITLDTGGTVNANCTSSAFPANSLVFSYTVAGGNLDINGITTGGAIEANGGTVRSAAGCDAVLALGTVDTSLVKVDGIAPAVDDANPATCYSAETHTLTIKISETGGIATGEGNSAVDVSKFKVWSGADSKTLTSGQSSAVITDAGTITITIGGTDLTAVQAFSGGEKLDKADVSAGGITDAAGNSNAEDLNNAITTLGAADVAADQAALAITYAGGDNATSVTQNLGLPISGANGTTISWQSSPAGVIANDGTVTRPSAGDVNVTLTATISKNGVSDIKIFTVTVKITDAGAVSVDQAALAITYAGSDNATSVTQNLGLSTSGTNGTTISWQSSPVGVIANDGTVTRPSSGDVSVTLTAAISKGGSSDSKIFPVTVKITDAGAVAVDKAALTITYAGTDNAASVTQDLGLLNSGANGTTISWQSNPAGVIANDGTVTRPSAGDVNVTLTATISKVGASDTKAFPVTVKISADGAVAADKTALAITFASGDSASSVTQSVYLPVTGNFGSSISWQSDNNTIITNDGTVSRPSDNDATVTLTATISKNGASDTKAFPVTVKISNTGAVAADKTALTITFASGDSAGSVTQSVYLPVTGSFGSSISWQSDNNTIITNDGTVSRPSFSAGDAHVTLTASLSKSGITDTKQFPLNVVKLPISDVEAVAADKAALAIAFAPGDSAGSVTQSVYLPTT
ncbi:MAG: immunoglobulin-like domain-containing protein, partial [Syntrophomonas sp.]